MKKHYLLASDFDQTLSFNDSGIILSDVLGIPGFREKVTALSLLTWCNRGPSSPTYCATTPNTGA